MEFPKYRSRPTEVFAFQWDGDNWLDLMAWARFVLDDEGLRQIMMWREGTRVKMQTIHGDFAYAEEGTWIIPEPQPGLFYPCEASVFANKYQEVT